MSAAERALDAAGIDDPELRRSYLLCRGMHAEYGKTYYLATLLLPPAKRPFVHALYGFARYADEIVDNGEESGRAERLTAWSARVLDDLAAGSTIDPVCRALQHTVRTWDIPHEHLIAFLESMAMDLTVTEYPAYADLERYMYGSAAVIGLQMVPILEPISAEAYTHAHQLGVAFQLTNFIRDVAEDLARGRVYLPLEDLAAFGLTRADLGAGVATPAVRELIRFEIDRTRGIYESSRHGVDLLHPTSRPCIETAFILYGEILDEIERQDCDVFARRARVGNSRRLAVAVPRYLRARKARLPQPVGAGRADRS
ncbi:phytoene/squalene synthase family protein [Nocardia sp. NPDC056100]|uniref:phytoene/squalene synthase family protein n=1 Tax=Nocardia sp. NPDC056100 TaxID=3345712 RepID=UPI0035E35402